MDDLTRLARAARHGDPAAVTAFVRASQRDVWRLCAHLLDTTVADDLTQDTYLRALPALPRFRGDASARTWLLSIARRACADELRRRARRPETPTDQLTGPPVADHTGHIHLADLITRLPPQRRTAFVLTQTLGCSYAEAAAITGCPIGTIRSQVARARTQLIAWANPGPISRPHTEPLSQDR